MVYRKLAWRRFKQPAGKGEKKVFDPTSPIIIVVRLVGYGVSLFLSNLIVNRFRDDEDKFTMTELVGTAVITCFLFGLYFVAAIYIKSLLYFSNIVFYGIFFLVFRPDSIIEGIAIVILSLPIFAFVCVILLQLSSP